MKKRITALILSLILIGSIFVPPIGVYATSDITNDESEAHYWPEGPEVTSASAIVMELSSGTILYEKNIHEKRYPASITKIMTVLLALENAELSETVTFSKDAVYKIDGTHIARDVGEQMTLEDTLYAVLLGSANECAYATAEHVGDGDYQTFIDMMNERAEEIGCLNTHFNNPHGLPDENHYTSAYDMALIAQEAFKNETFRTITDTSKYTIPPTNKHSDPTYIVNHHCMHNYYRTGEYIKDYCIGGKTGHTSVAGATLVTYAEKDGMQIVCVVMKTTHGDHYKDTIKLCDFTFDNFQAFKVAESETRLTEEGFGDIADFVEDISYLSINKEAVVVLPKAAELDDTTVTLQPSQEGNTYASMVYEYAGRVVGQASLISKGTLPEKYPFGAEQKDEEEKKKDGVVVTVTFKIVILAILIVIIIAIIIAIIIYLKRNYYIFRHYIRQRKADRRRELHFKERDRRREKRRRDRQGY